MKYRTRFRCFFLTLVLFNLAANFAHPVTPTLIKNLNLDVYKRQLHHTWTAAIM